MGQFDIRAALIQSVVDQNLEIGVRYPNKADNFKPPFAEVSVVFSQPAVATLGDKGEDNHTGFLQVMLNYPLGTSDGELWAMAEEIMSNYKAGHPYFYNGQKVTITNAGVGTFREVNGAYAAPITINWYARTTRS